MCHHCGEFEDHSHEETIRQLEDEIAVYQQQNIELNDKLVALEKRIDKAAIRVQVECESTMDDGSASFIASHVRWIKHLEFDQFPEYGKGLKCTCTKS